MIVDGIKLLIMLKNKELKNRTKIKWGSHELEVIQRSNRLYIIDADNKETFKISFYGLQDDDFEILSEEDTEIDIDNIEEINAEKIVLSWNKNEKEIFQENRRKINELIKAVKQLNKKIGDD